MRLVQLLIAMIIFVPNALSQSDTVITTSKYKYVGQFPNGNGVLYNQYGIIIGNFENMTANGVGTHHSKNGTKYHGEFRNGRYCGTGRLDNPNGVVYIGEFPSGSGVLYTNSGIYIGNFEERELKGVCTYYNKDGVNYHGEFLNGKYHGYGRLELPERTIYLGHFKDGKPYGIDTVYSFFTGMIDSRSVEIGNYNGTALNGYGERYIHSKDGYTYQHGEYVRGNIMDGESLSEDGGRFIINGRFIGSFSSPKVYYQQIINTYNMLIGQRDKYIGAKLTDAQKAFLNSDDKANSLFPFPGIELTEQQKAYLKECH